MEDKRDSKEQTTFKQTQIKPEQSFKIKQSNQTISEPSKQNKQMKQCEQETQQQKKTNAGQNCMKHMNTITT